MDPGNYKRFQFFTRFGLNWGLARSISFADSCLASGPTLDESSVALDRATVGARLPMEEGLDIPTVMGEQIRQSAVDAQRPAWRE